LSKILQGDPPERNPWDRVPELTFGVSSNLMRCRNSLLKEFDPVETLLQSLRFSLVPDFGADHSHLRGRRRFCANFLKVLKHPHCVKPENPVRILIPTSPARPADTLVHRVRAPRAAQRKYQRATGKTPAPAAADTQKPWLPGLAMVLFSQDCLEGLRGVFPASPGPANQLPAAPVLDRYHPVGDWPFRATRKLHCLQLR
jgi:hypothetical protein